jgi:DMSO/TMAO reductase YedYZ molybdopterin-dependent catalytic subunit
MEIDDKTIKSPDTLRKDRVPPGQRLTQKWPVLHYGSVPNIDPNKWTFTISGLLDKERVLSFAEFTALSHVQVFSDIHCVTGWSRLDNLWEGVGASAVKDVAGIKPEARFVIVHGSGGFTTNLSLDDFFQPDVLFALKFDGKPVEKDHGAPVRLIVPRLYFWKSAKWVTGIEFVEKDKPGFWESNGYHIRGDPWLEQRYSCD